MQHSFLATVLLILSNASAQDIPANPNSLPAGGSPINSQSNGNPQSTLNSGNGQAGPATEPKIISLNCTNTLLPFSDRELAEMAQTDPTTDSSKNTPPGPDLKTLSTNQTSALCMSDTVTAFCVLNSCDITKTPAPVCQTCSEYTPSRNGDDGVVGTVVVPQVICDDNYSFNKTASKIRYVCSSKTNVNMTYSCQSCQGARGCDTCYDVNDLANAPPPAGPAGPPPAGPSPAGPVGPSPAGPVGPSPAGPVGPPGPTATVPTNTPINGTSPINN